MLLNNRTGYFDRLNLDNSEITPIRAGGFCSSILPGTEEVVCGYPGRYILRNLVTGGEQQLPIENTCRFYGWSPNGRFLIYEYCKPDGSYRLTTYDLVTQIEQEVASFSQSFGEREWNTIPLISYDGEHLIAGGKTVFEIDPKTLERHPIGVLEPLTTWDIALSPTANQIVYGVTDIFQEIGSFPNYLYLYDFDSGENSLLATAPEGNVYDWFFSTPIWSPDGSKVVVASGSYLCVIEIILLEQTCHDLFPYEGLSSMTWSPGSQYIAIDAGYWGNPISDLIIYDVAKGSYFVLISGLELENEILNVLFWR
jgi:Tol biopolymer transport system component